jgi:hypothetical protein
MERQHPPQSRRRDKNADAARRLVVEAARPSSRSGLYASWASFSDPDGNAWLLQEVTKRLPGRVEAKDMTFSTMDLAAELRRAAAAHGEHEKRNGGKYDDNWPDGYAEHIVAEHAGRPLPL